jgi:tetratricopeptide (TPR) repeat protein
MPSTALYKYTPGQASPEELQATFVGRDGLLDHLLARARDWRRGAAPEHTLLLGPRGIGKTHLLRLFAHRVTADTYASPLDVATFPEESYAVGSSDELMVEIWTRLGMTEPPPKPAAVGAAWVLDELRALHSQHGTRFLVLLDGFDLLLDQLRESDEARLHRLLTTEPHICLVATAAHTPSAVIDHDRPLYHLLRLEPLRPLEAPQAEELVRRRAEWAGDRALLDRWPELSPRARAVAELTGGNPRLLLMLYQSLQLGELPTVVDAFRALLDELTPFYKHVVESRAPQQRKLLTLAAFHDRGASPSQLAQESGLPERQVSALLGHLETDRLLRRVRRPGARTSAYPFTEPLLRMWLQMRASPEGERRVHCIVEFFRIWFAHSSAEYEEVFASQAERASKLLQTGELHALRDALLGLSYLVQAAPSLTDCLAALHQLLTVDISTLPEEETKEVMLLVIECLLEIQPVEPSTLLVRSLLLARVGRVEEALADLNRCVELQPDEPELLVHRGIVLTRLGRYAAALADFDRAVELEPDSHPILALRVDTLFNLERYNEALADCDRALQLRPDDAEMLCKRSNLLGLLSRDNEALAACNHALELQPDYTEALSSRGLTLFSLGRFTEALADFGRALELQPDHYVAIRARIRLLRHLRRYSEALTDYSHAIHLQPDEPVTAFGRSITLLLLDRVDEALADLSLGIAKAIAQTRLHVAVPLVLAEVIGRAAALDHPREAQVGISALPMILSRIPAERRRDALLNTANTVFGFGQDWLCEETLELLSPLADDPLLLEPFRQALVYLRGGRDPYVLEALNPDIRRAVELVIEQFGSQRPGQTESSSVEQTYPPHNPESPPLGG